jgi:regulation of enolase protein 1 (concanavalin A-like superfamily)
MQTISWDQMTWLNEPPEARVEGDDLVVVTGKDTDFWHRTSYGFRHDNGHALTLPLDGDAAIEVTFRTDFEGAFDQAGLMLRAGPELWIKTGVELSDGILYAGAVVTVGMSDWSVSPLPDSARGQALTFRASRAGDAVTIRYRVGDEPGWRFLRLAYFPPEAGVSAGPMCCSPSREGLSVRFEPVRVGPPDAALHEE